MLSRGFFAPQPGKDLTTALTWDILYGDGVVISTDQNGKTTNYTYGLERISETIWNRPLSHRSLYLLLEKI